MTQEEIVEKLEARFHSLHQIINQLKCCGNCAEGRMIKAALGGHKFICNANDVSVDDGCCSKWTPLPDDVEAYTTAMGEHA